MAGVGTAQAAQTISVRGIGGAAAAANGMYHKVARTRHQHCVYVQEPERAHELSFDGGAWTLALVDERAKCWVHGAPYQQLCGYA
jgi:hypothetical protein|eukprot:COSAG01_NODE_4568_length_4917_cov_3.350073_5_plen_85_part_00